MLIANHFWSKAAADTDPYVSWTIFFVPVQKSVSINIYKCFLLLCDSHLQLFFIKSHYLSDQELNIAFPFIETNLWFVGLMMSYKSSL